MELSDLKITFTEMFELEEVKTRQFDYVLFAYTDNDNKYSVHQKIKVKNKVFGYTENTYEYGYYSTLENCIKRLINKKYEDIESLINYYEDIEENKQMFFILRNDCNRKYLYLVNDKSLLYLNNEENELEIKDNLLKIYDFSKKNEVNELRERIEYFKEKDIKELSKKYHNDNGDM